MMTSLVGNRKSHHLKENKVSASRRLIVVLDFAINKALGMPALQQQPINLKAQLQTVKEEK